MAANVSVPNNFVAGTPAVADDVDANFSALVNWINTNAVHLDAAKAFTNVPSGPAVNPTAADHLTRKAYVDAKADTRVGCTVRRSATSQTFPISATTAVSWDTEVADTNGFYSGSGFVTIPVGFAGVYAVTVVFYDFGGLAASNTQVRPDLTLAGLGSTPLEMPAANGGSANHRSVSVIVPLAEGVQINPRMRNDSGSTAITAKCEMFVYRISE
jgi:hypothetical protein